MALEAIRCGEFSQMLFKKGLEKDRNDCYSKHSTRSFGIPIKGYMGKAGTVQRKKGAAPSPFTVQLSFQECSDGVYVKTQNHCLSC